MFEVTKIELRNVLSNLFPDEEDAKPVVEFTSVDMGWIDFSGAPKRMWHNILTKAAEYDDGIKDIIKNALAEYEEGEIEGGEILKNALEYGVVMDGQTGEKQSTEKEVYVPFKNILKFINKDNFGEIRRVDCDRSDQLKLFYKSSNDSCTIAYSIGTINDKPNSFAERIMLQTLEDSKDIDSDDNNCWLYRMPNGDRRVDEIPFSIRPNLELSKKLFCKKMESLFDGLNMDDANKYFAHKNFRNISIAINYDYSIGDDILEPFTEYIYNTFSGIAETTFQIFFIFTGFNSTEKILKETKQVIKSLEPIPIISIPVIDPVNEVDIQSWKGKLNLDSYTQDEFISDLTYLKVAEKDIANFKNTKKVTMQVMEIFQNNLYDTFHKNS